MGLELAPRYHPQFATYRLPGCREAGHAALVQLREPVNKSPDFVRYIVRQRPAALSGFPASRLRSRPATTNNSARPQQDKKC